MVLATLTIRRWRSRGSRIGWRRCMARWRCCAPRSRGWPPRARISRFPITSRRWGSPSKCWGSVAKIVKLEHAWRRLDGRNDDGFQVAPFPGRCEPVGGALGLSLSDKLSRPCGRAAETGHFGRPSYDLPLGQVLRPGDGEEAGLD